MKNIKLIHTLIEIMLFLIGISILIGLVLTFLSLFGFDTGIFNIGAQESLFEESRFILLVSLIIIIIYSISLYGLIKLRNAIKNLISDHHFALSVTQNFNHSGKAFVLASILHWFFTGILPFITESKLQLGLSGKTIAYLFVVVMGLLLILLSEILSSARKLKEENDLTI